MGSRRHPIVVIAIAFAIVPSLIELANAGHAGLRLAGWPGELLNWADPSRWDEPVLSFIFSSRWPLMMLIAGLALLTSRARWAVPVAWAYFVVMASTAIARLFLSQNNYLGGLTHLDELSIDVKLDFAAGSLTLLLTQAMDVLPAALLLIAAKAMRPAPAAVELAEPTLPSSPIGSPVLGYYQTRVESDFTRWGLRFAFGVACLATVRLLVELTPLVMRIVVPQVTWGSADLPMYLFTGPPRDVLDGLSEYALRLGWVLLLVGLWPTRRLVWSRSCVVVGCVVIGAWAVLETTAVAISPGIYFIVAGHGVFNLMSCVRIACTELAAPAMVLALLQSPLP